MKSKVQAFIAEYPRDFNGTQAAIRAGYSPRSAGQQASRLLKNEKVQSAIRVHINERIMSADEVLLRLADQARGSMEDFINPSSEVLDLAKAEHDGKLHLIKKFSRTDGEKVNSVAVELYDAQSALVQLARVHGLLKDKTEVTGKDGGPVQTSTVVVYLPDNGRPAITPTEGSDGDAPEND